MPGRNFVEVVPSRRPARRSIQKRAGRRFGPKRVEAGQARPEHDQSSFDHGGGGTPRLESAISQGRQQRRGEAEDLFAVVDQAAENG